MKKLTKNVPNERQHSGAYHSTQGVGAPPQFLPSLDYTDNLGLLDWALWNIRIYSSMLRPI